MGERGRTFSTPFGHRPDNSILVGSCGTHADEPPFRLTVDDLAYIQHEEDRDIHVTARDTTKSPPGELFCFRLSVDSARKLVRHLQRAIARRGGRL
jgi:hypothetical protein